MQVVLTMSTIGTGTQIFLELSTNIDANNGAFAMFQAVGNTRFRSKGTIATDATLAIPTPPDTYVLTGLGDISGDSSILRKDGVQVGSSTGDQGTGNYNAYVLCIGDRDSVGLNTLGAFYGLMVRFGPSLSGSQLTDVETWANALRTP